MMVAALFVAFVSLASIVVPCAYASRGLEALQPLNRQERLS